MRILVVEDDKLLAKGVGLVLKKQGYEIDIAYTYEEGMTAFKGQTIDLMLLDINLKGKSGLDLCGEVRKISGVPIIFITARDTEEDMIEGFDQGCDDYIAKPFSLEVLKRRVEVILKRVGKEKKILFEDGGIRIDYDMKQVSREDTPIKLTATEYRLLEVLTQHKGQVLTREMLLEKLWDINGKFIDENTLSVNIRRLRGKIETNPKMPEWIVTVFGIGYTWGQ
ncbi:MAG: response regulator transcription factor [Niameybacter sp.]|uniref:response regulator transcription factor n=1 Tax=Niameybacter sp. TaxID=2033640 RepID=UPI002FC866C6